jgi:hypothetical protein
MIGSVVGFQRMRGVGGVATATRHHRVTPEQGQVAIVIPGLEMIERELAMARGTRLRHPSAMGIGVAGHTVLVQTEEP